MCMGDGVRNEGVDLRIPRKIGMNKLLCLSLGILGPNERAYLGDDLKDVWVFHPETEM